MYCVDMKLKSFLRHLIENLLLSKELDSLCFKYIMNTSLLLYRGFGASFGCVFGTRSGGADPRIVDIVRDILQNPGVLKFPKW